MQKKTDFSTELPCYLSFFYIKLGRFSFNRSAILSFCLKLLCTQGSPCLFPWQPLSSSFSLASLLPSHLPLQVQEKTEEAWPPASVWLAWVCLPLPPLKWRQEASRLMSRTLSTDARGKQLGRQTQTLEETISLWGGGLQVLGNWLVYCKSGTGASLRVDVIVNKIDAQTWSLSDGEDGGILIRGTQYFIISSVNFIRKFHSIFRHFHPSSPQSIHTITASIFWPCLDLRSFPSRCPPLTKAAYCKTASQ